MSVSPGDKLGAYEILSQIGAGGMGEVYRARDTTLGREVAIKVLPEAFAKDAERLARFEREARLLASLNHPNIATIHGLELSGTTRFLVMELVPGETLADRIKQSAIPVEDALPLFMQIAEALEAAHEKGIIHRDLKPANIKLTPDDKVKVLDFGLAKATVGTPSGESSESPTITHGATAAGTILGTAGYMSPEQARGKTVDQRADIWAFGCCLYEALSGQVTFQGDTLSDTLAAVLRQEPDWQALPETTPGSIRRLLDRCLQKDPRRRYRDAWDVRVEIEEALAEPAVTPSKPVARERSRSWRTMPWVAAFVFALLATAIGIWSWMSPGPPSAGAVTRLRLTTPPLGDGWRMLAISPDGTRLAFIGHVNGTRQIFLRSLDRLDAKPMEGTEGAWRILFFSPDGEWVGFLADDKLKKVSVAGGAPATLCDAPGAGHPAWGPDDRIYFKVGRRILSVSAAGGTPQAVSSPEEVSHRPLEVLPGGKALLIAVARTKTWDDFDQLEIGTLSLETGEYRTLIERASRGSYAPTGHLVFTRAGTLLAVPFDVGRLEVTGAEVPVLEGLPGPYGRPFRISENGTLVYVPGRAERGKTLVWVNREGEARPVTDVRRDYQVVRISPDGQRIALEILTEGNYDIWIYDIPRGTLTRLTLAESLDTTPVWSADGKRVAFSSERDGGYGVYWKPIDGSGPTERLTDGAPQSWSPDGRVLAFYKGGDIWMLPMEGERKPEPFLDTPFKDFSAAFSPDGRWIAYHSDESGRYEVYVRAYPGPGGKWQISTHGGLFAVWSPDGREIFYRTVDKKVMVVPVQLTPEFSPGKPKMLFEDRFVRIGFGFRDYDITPDGQRFVMVEDAEEEAAPTEIVVVLNWFEELKRLVPTE